MNRSSTCIRSFSIYLSFYNKQFSWYQVTAIQFQELVHCLFTVFTNISKKDLVLCTGECIQVNDTEEKLLTYF